MPDIRQEKYLLFHPTSIVHYRNISLLAKSFADYKVRCILDPKLPWLSTIGKSPYELFYFLNDRANEKCLEGVAGVIVFSSQPRVASVSLIQLATMKHIPIIAIEEVYQMMLEQGYVNEYFVPVDALLVGSDFERGKFIEFGMPNGAYFTTGCIFAKAPSTVQTTSRKNEQIFSVLGLIDNSPVAVLSLAYQTPSGETLAVRERLLKIVAEGLPGHYQLLVKPHPAESDKRISAFVAQYAPRAKVADKYIPINEILNITDVLINRGNSQVVVDALQRGIPVIAIPLGRNTFFHDTLDQVIVNDKNDISPILELIQKEGFALYKPIFDKFLTIDPDAALANLVNAINKIIEEHKVHNSTERLMDIVLYWAWMGYLKHAQQLISKLKTDTKVNMDILILLENLIKINALPINLAPIKNWYENCQYRSWLLKSLWIKNLYLKKNTLSEQEQDWITDFPPRTNREYFINYCYMLGKCYLRAGLRSACEALLNKIYVEYNFLKCIQNLKQEFDAKKQKYFDIRYWRTYVNYSIGAPTL